MVAGDANLDPRDKIACNISQLLIFNAVMGTYHTVNTPAVRLSKERETPFPLYQAHQQSNKILQTNGGAAGLNEIHEALMLMPQRTPPIHSEYRVIPAPDLLQRKGCQAVLLPSRNMIYPFRTSLASCAPPRDDMLNIQHKCLVDLVKSSCTAIRLEDLI